MSRPTPAMKFFGATLRDYRERAGLNRKELADRVGYAESTVQAFEAGKRVPKADQIPVIDKAVGADGALLVAARQLEEEGKYPEYFEEFRDCEENCLSMSVYDTMAIPGLLQTEAYARAVLEARCPDLDDDVIELRLRGRMERQALLTRRPPAVLSFILDESVLRRMVGGVEVMREQLRHLVTCAQMRNVSLQVLPLSTTSHSGLDGPFTLITTSDGRDLAYGEGQFGSQWVGERNRERLHALTQRHGKIRGQALTTEDSIKLIERIAGELER